MGWALLQSLIIHKRAYVVVNFPYVDSDEHSADDATYTALGAPEVDDWQKNDKGEYDWVRTHCVDLTRSKKPVLSAGHRNAHMDVLHAYGFR